MSSDVHAPPTRPATTATATVRLEACKRNLKRFINQKEVEGLCSRVGVLTLSALFKEYYLKVRALVLYTVEAPPFVTRSRSLTITR
jgi:hypothetical protein